jgi:hypothetical protein
MNQIVLAFCDLDGSGWGRLSKWNMPFPSQYGCMHELWWCTSCIQIEGTGTACPEGRVQGSLPWAWVVMLRRGSDSFSQLHTPCRREPCIPLEVIPHARQRLPRRPARSTKGMLMLILDEHDPTNDHNLSAFEFSWQIWMQIYTSTNMIHMKYVIAHSLT